MNYTRITVPRTPTVPRGTYIRCDADETPAISASPAPPSAVTVAAQDMPHPRRRLNLGLPIRLTLGGVFCFVSFMAGCALGDAALCRALVTLGAASGGRLTCVPPSAAQTMYARLSEESVQSTGTSAPQYVSDDLTYLEALPVTVPESQPTDAVVSASSDKVYADGEVLYPVEGRDLSCADVHSLGNQTPFAPDTHALLVHTPSSLTHLAIPADEPLVLIVHTHGTECYNEEGMTDYYRAAAPVRDEDITKNVVSMGTELEKVLTAFGIPVLHDTKMCDKESFVKAYSVSYEEVTRLLAEHPSIRFVIDLHRDAIEGENGLRYKPVYQADGGQTAQLMFVVGTNAAGNPHPDWEENLSLALHIEDAANRRFPGLMRHINLRQASFNQQLCDGYMLLECGSCSNTHEEARRAIRLFGEAMAQVIYEYAE